MARAPLRFGLRLGVLWRTWDWGDTTHRELASTLDLDGDQLSKLLSGVTKAPRDFVEATAIEDVASLFERREVLKKRATNKKEFVDALRGPDKQFLYYATQSGSSPSRKRPSLRVFERLDTRKMDEIEEDIVGHFWMYRLGINASRRGRTVIVDSQSYIALKRIPVKIDRAKGDEFFSYKESFDSSEATGDLFIIDEYCTIIGEDADGRVSEMFLAQFHRHSDNHGLYQGVVAMDGDVGSPSAYKFILRRAQKGKHKGKEVDWTTEDWDKFVKSQLNVRLCDIDGDGLLDATGVEEETGETWDKYVKMLNIINAKVDIQFEHASAQSKPSKVA